MVVVMELADGMIEGIMRRFIELGTYHAQAAPFGVGSAEELEGMAAEVGAIPGVAHAYAELQGGGVAISGKSRCAAQIRAVEPRLLESDPAFLELVSVKDGKMLLENKNSAVLGSALAKKLKLKSGSRVSLLTLRSSKDGRVIPRISTFVVSGIISSGYQELDALWFFITLEEGFRILPAENSVPFVGIKTDRIETPSNPNIDPEPYLGIRAGLDPDLEFHPWYKLIESQYQSLLSTKMWLLLITGLIVIVACFNVYQAVVMLVIERRQEIAILKSLGASERGITVAFTLSGAFIGAVAMVLGMAIGLFMAVNINESVRLMEGGINWIRWADAQVRQVQAEPIRLLDPQYYLEKIPIRLSFPELLTAACATIVLAALAAYLPARKAGRIAPLEVMRKI
jgi:lipoprotein-releasing system permease protein